MDDLIYSFLLQSDYPRASIILDLDLLGPAAQPGSGMTAPSFVIVDPHTAETLAVIEVVDSIDGDMLRQVAIETGAYASRLGGKAIQGFVIRVDVNGHTEAEQVQFYRIWPNSTLQQLSSKTFPDLDSLRVARALSDAINNPAPASSNLTSPALEQLEKDSEEPAGGPGMGMGMYLPAVILLLLFLVDAYFQAVQGESFLSVPQSVLAIGAAMLLTLPAAIRYLRK